MTDQLRQTAQQALEALEWISALQTGGMIQVRATEPQAGLRMALEQQAEPVYRKGCAECGKAKQVQEDDDEWKADLAKGRKILAQQSDPGQSVAFQHRQEQIEKKMAGVYSAFSTTHPALEQQAEPVFNCPQKTPLTHEQRLDVLTAFEKHKAAWNAPSILIDLVEAAHNIK